MENPAVLWAAGGFLLNLLVMVIGGVWQLSRLELALREAINQSRKDVDEQLDIRDRRLGESMLALRQQNTDLGFYVRDNFIRKDELQTQLKSLSDKLDKIHWTGSRAPTE